MSPYLPIATWPACKRNIEEDCKRKLRSLGISAKYCTAFLQDIFGSDVNHEKGLIDAGARTLMLNLKVWKTFGIQEKSDQRVQCSLIQAKQNFTSTL